MTTTHTSREHLDAEEISKTSTRELWRYVKRELAFLSSAEQRRIPQSVHAAIDELSKRTR